MQFSQAGLNPHNLCVMMSALYLSTSYENWAFDHVGTVAAGDIFERLNVLPTYLAIILF